MRYGGVIKKPVAEDYLRLSIFDLRRLGYLINRTGGTVTWSRSNSSIAILCEWLKEDVRMRFVYTQTDRVTGKKQKFNYTVGITTTPCNFGYYRFWFICPLIKNGVPCGRRVGVLYGVNGYFGCRHCHNLSYASRNEDKSFRTYPWRILADDEKRERLLKRMKHRYYAGKPTHRYGRVLALEHSYYSLRPSTPAVVAAEG